MTRYLSTILDLNVFANAVSLMLVTALPQLDIFLTQDQRIYYEFPGFGVTPPTCLTVALQDFHDAFLIFF